MLDILISKLHAWSFEKADKFHNNALRGNLDGSYIWEKDTDGFYICRGQGVIFCSNQGIVYILTTSRNTNDWDSHMLLYEQTKNNPLCRIDVPITCEKLYLKGILFYYMIFERPNKQIGTDYHLDIFNGKVNDDYFLQYIEDAAILINELRICSQTHNTLFPLTGVTIFKRVFDSQGWFWIDFKKWESDYESFLQASYDTLASAISYLDYNNLGEYDKELILKVAKEKWNIV